MSSPRRWVDGGDELTPDERRTLGADLGCEAPLHTKRAVRAALALKLSAASAAAAAPSALRGSIQKGAATKLVSVSLLKSAAVGFGLSAVVGLGFSLSEWHNAGRDASFGAVRHVPPPPSAQELRAPANSAVAVQPEPSSAQTEAPQGRALRRSVPREAAFEPPSLPATAATSESQRVAEARALLRSGRAAQALVALQALERDEPNGLLVQEREALSIQTLAALGQREAARKRAALFAVRYPASPHLSAVRRAAE
jgi:hypothetical protein